jgi:hypothetical protein
LGVVDMEGADDHFNGSSWKNVTLPSAVKGKYELLAADESANNDIWAAGSSAR